MPYYVYGVHPETLRLYDKFGDFKEATSFENEVRVDWSPKDNYFVTMIHAEADKGAEEKANLLRQRFRK